MATTFTWTIRQLKRKLSNDSITEIDWLCVASETVGSGDDAVTHTARTGGKTHNAPDPSDSNFIAYASIKESDAIGWVQEVVSKSDTETELQAMLDEKKAPSTKTGLPW